ncbi:hypothetical protein NA57DRAFT_80355 [Rhizodiscina lignyota]|uniref:Nuclear pore assembly and biogenesis-domain-containing protein n=1 Tax=Rhizodiscina lignyota TaxID=1504668 RepID=A0A9P4M680_9PEZI|nr:hypothetical protein NA57DRAFT_80355 [Rhizodiscina lignyota]
MEFLRGYAVILPAPLHGPYNVLAAMSYKLGSILSSLLSHIQQSPDIASIALLLILLFISLKIVNLLFRTIMFWVDLFFKIAFYGGLAALGLWVWSRGIDGVEEDLSNLVGMWSAEYRFWKEREKMGVQGMYGGQRARYNTVVGGGGGGGHGRWGL